VAMFSEYFLLIVLFSAACTALAVTGIWQKDRAKYFALEEKATKIKFKDGWEALRNNRSVQLLMIAAGTDKLFSSVMSNAVIMVILFGIVCGDFALLGLLNLYVFMPVVIVSLLCAQYARRFGQKAAFLFGTYGSMVSTILIFALFMLGIPATLSFTNWGWFTVLFLIFISLRGGFMNANTSIIIPMISDCADYEATRSGKYLPGMIGAMFSFVDKVIASLTNVIVGALVILAGYSTFPTVNTPYSDALFWVAMICYCGLPMLGWGINIVCMKFYPLDRTTMAEVQKKTKK